MNSLILRTVTRLTIHLITIFSIYLFFRGHNNPGGGFIAGLMTSAALVLVSVAFGLDFVKRVLPFDFRKVVALGLLVAAGTGAAALVLGFPFLTHTFGHLELPLLGEIEWATAQLFDLGVYLVVVGTTMTVILSIGGD